MTDFHRAGCCCDCYIVPELCGLMPNVFGCFGACIDAHCWDEPYKCVENHVFTNPFGTNPIPPCECFGDNDPEFCSPCEGTGHPPCCPKECDWRTPAPGAFPILPLNQPNSCMPNGFYCEGYQTPGSGFCEPLESGAGQRPYLRCELAPGIACEKATPEDCINLPWQCDTKGDGLDFLVFSHHIQYRSNPPPTGWDYCYWIHKRFPHRTVSTCEQIDYISCEGIRHTGPRDCLDPETEIPNNQLYKSCFHCCGCGCIEYCLAFDPCLFEEHDEPPCQFRHNLTVSFSANDFPNSNKCDCLCRQNDSSTDCFDCGFNYPPFPDAQCPKNPNFQQDIVGCDPENQCPDCWCEPTACCPDIFDGYFTVDTGCVIGSCGKSVCMKRPSHAGCPSDDFYNPDQFCCTENNPFTGNPFCFYCGTLVDAPHWLGSKIIHGNGCGACQGAEFGGADCCGGVSATMTCISPGPGVDLPDDLHGTAWSIGVAYGPSWCCPADAPDYACDPPSRCNTPLNFSFLAVDPDQCKCPNEIEDWDLHVVGECLNTASLGSVGKTTVCPSEAHECTSFGGTG